MDAEPIITSIILSDGVIVEAGTGKMSRIGCFNSLLMPRGPHPGFFASVGITNVLSVASELKVTVRIEDPTSGHVLGSAGAEMKFENPGPDGPHPPPEIRNLILDISVRFNHVLFPRPGLYEVVVLVDNEPLQKRALLVQPI